MLAEVGITCLVSFDIKIYKQLLNKDLYERTLVNIFI